MNTRHFFKRYCRHVCVKDFLVKKAMRRHLANKKKKRYCVHCTITSYKLFMLIKVHHYFLCFLTPLSLFFPVEVFW